MEDSSKTPQKDSDNPTPLPNAITQPQTPTKRKWYQNPKIMIPLATVVLLIVLGGAGAQRQSVNAPKQTSTPQTISNKPADDIPVYTKGTPQEKSYFSTVWAHLDTIGKQSQALGQACGTKFPPPTTCADSITTYRQSLLEAKADLDKVSAPAVFQKADATIRDALNTDIQATEKALEAIKANDFAKWATSIAQHAQAGQKVNQASAEALEVLR